MEFEELYNMDKTPVERPKITQMVIDTFTKILDDQDLKGIKKYGRTIDDADDSQYNWLLMSLEELADFTKYQVKEIKRLENSVKAHEEVGQGYHQEIVELKRELTRAENTAGEYQKAYKNVCAERDEFKRRYLKAHAEIQDLQYQKKILAEQLTLATSGEKKNHDCHKNQAIHWQGKDIVKVKCLICDKTLYQA